MIAMIEGKIVNLSAPSACIMTSGGVGYDIEMTVSDFCRLSMGETVTLYTHMVVREDHQGLYGFCDKGDRDVFRKLIRISGVGAKMALAMLSTMSSSELAQSVATGNEAALVRIPGVGKKTAQRLIIELTGKLEHTQDGLLDAGKPTTQMQVLLEVQGALIGLGYTEKEAQNAVKQSYSEGMDTQTLLKSSLKVLSGLS